MPRSCGRSLKRTVFVRFYIGNLLSMLPIELAKCNSSSGQGYRQLLFLQSMLGLQSLCYSILRTMSLLICPILIMLNITVIVFPLIVTLRGTVSLLTSQVLNSSIAIYNLFLGTQEIYSLLKNFYKIMLMLDLGSTSARAQQGFLSIF